ncbi:tetratricopeptide repeat protein [bacterium]|nr:tetratricopeptide repeat protein [bacterium]QQR57101.1 MAG: tetratricopeptide repeat protein [Candidatus Melainabacteria bacterium]
MSLGPKLILPLTLALILCQTALAADKTIDALDTAAQMFVQGQADQAKSMLDNLINQKGLTKAQLERGHVLKGKIFLQKSQVQEAIAEFKEALKSNPQSIDARYMLALTYFDMGDFANAETYFKELVHKKSDNFEYVYNLGVAQGKMAHIDDAIGTLSKASKMTDSKGEPQFAMGEIYQLDKQYDKALARYEECIVINPKFAEVYNNMGVIYSIKSDFPSAVKSFQKALELKPNYNPARKNLGYAEAHTAMAVSLMTQGKLGEAQAQLQKAIEIDPQFADAHYNLGLLLHQQNQVAQAILHYQAALQNDPRHARAHNNLGVAYQSQGQVDLAKKEYGEAVRLKPDYTEAKDNLDKLDKLPK